MTTARLSRPYSARVDADGSRAPITPEAIGIVHLGIGAFHRAHQAVCTEEAMRQSGDLRWGILGVTQRSADVREQLRPQGGLFTVVTADAGGARAQVVGAVQDVAWPAEETERVLSMIAASTTHVVMLTITEKGYPRNAAGGLDVAAIHEDLRAVGGDETGEVRAAGSAVGLLVRALIRRQRGGGAPITVLSCDNLPGNGRILHALVRDAADELAVPGFSAWLDASVTFPCSMVDRIVPVTTEQWRRAGENLTGYRDTGLVVAEPYFQWVIEDDFAGPRPPWERAGAVFVDDVEPFERAKLRLLNAAHSVIAYAGARRGHETVASAMADPEILSLARALQADAAATLIAPEGVVLVDYCDEILRRFANTAIVDTPRRIAADGTQKIPLRWGQPLAELAAQGIAAPGIEAAYREWAEFVVDEVHAGRELVDPQGAQLRAIVQDFPRRADAMSALIAIVHG